MVDGASLLRVDASSRANPDKLIFLVPGSGGAVDTGPDSLGLGPFLQRLGECLATLSHSELKAKLLDHAARLPAAERADFLAVFEQPPPDPSVATDSEHVDDTLVTDVDGFLADVANGVYVGGWGYDPEYRDHRAYGDESWTREFDSLAERAANALLAGDASTARAAYRGLFKALTGGYDGGGRPVAGTPDEFVATDITEAKHRYLRAVWEDEPVETRAAAVVAAISELTYVGGRTSLAALAATRGEALPDLDAVLPDLIETLSRVPDDYGFGEDARRLIAESVQLGHGPDGLAAFARTPGPYQPAAYRDWVDALANAGRLEEAEAAAIEGMRKLESHGRTVAALAGRLALMAAARGDDRAVLAACQSAWRANPTIHGLLRLVEVATALGAFGGVIATEADRVNNEQLSRQQTLAAALLLLAGRVDSAIELLDPGVPNGNAGPAPADVVLPFLLIGAGNAHHDPVWEQTLLHTLLDQVDLMGWRHGAYGMDHTMPERLVVAAAGDEDAPLGARYHAIARDELRLPVLLIRELDRTPPTVDQRARWLRIARSSVDLQIDSVVSGQHRTSYPHVALLAAGCAEAIKLSAGAAVSQRYLDVVHGRYSRHTAFARELRDTVARSPLLT